MKFNSSSPARKRKNPFSFLPSIKANKIFANIKMNTVINNNVTATPIPHPDEPVGLPGSVALDGADLAVISKAQKQNEKTDSGAVIKAYNDADHTDDNPDELYDSGWQWTPRDDVDKHI